MIITSINMWTANQIQANTTTNIILIILTSIIAIEIGFIIYQKYFKKK